MPIGKSCKRAGFPCSPDFVRLLKLPTAVLASEESPAAIVQRLFVRQGLESAGEDFIPGARQAGRSAAPERPGTVVGRLVGIDAFLSFHERLQSRGGIGDAPEEQ